MKRAALFFSLLLALLLCACQAAPQEPELPPDALVDYLALSELSPQPVPCTESALADLLPLTVLGNTHETVFTYFQDGQMTISHQLEMQHCVSDENGASLFTPDRAVVMRDAALLFLCFDDLDRVCIRFDWSGLNHWIGDSLIRLDNLYGRIWETTISRPEAEAALGFTVDDLRRLLDEGRFAEADSVLKAVAQPKESVIEVARLDGDYDNLLMCYVRASEIAEWFDNTLPISGNHSIEIDGVTYFQVDESAPVSSYETLMQRMRNTFSEEQIERLMMESSEFYRPVYIEHNGRLYGGNSSYMGSGMFRTKLFLQFTGPDTAEIITPCVPIYPKDGDPQGILLHRMTLVRGEGRWRFTDFQLHTRLGFEDLEILPFSPR